MINLSFSQVKSSQHLDSLVPSGCELLGQSLEDKNPYPSYVVKPLETLTMEKKLLSVHPNCSALRLEVRSDWG